MIKPANSQATCLHWQTLPKGRHYLAACISDLMKIMEMYGSESMDPPQLVDELLWHSPLNSLAQCPCIHAALNQNIQDDSNQTHHDPVQVLLPANMTMRRILPATCGPGRLKNGGAIVFGHNSILKCIWGEHGNPMIGASPPAVELDDLESTCNGRGNDISISGSSQSTLSKGVSSLLSSLRGYSKARSIDLSTEPSSISDSSRADQVTYGSISSQPSEPPENPARTRRLKQRRMRLKT
jgi:hypothetical protein